MSLTIIPAPGASRIPSSAAPPPEAAASASGAEGKPAAQPSAGSAAMPRGQQQAALNRLLAKYTYEQSRGAAANTLAALGKQITAAAKALGQHVTLPHAPAIAGAGSATPATSATPQTGKVSLTA